MSDFVIRQAVAADAAAIDRLFVVMLQTIYQRAETPSEPVNYMEMKADMEGSRIYVTEADGKVMAFASVEEHRETGEPFLYLDDFSVAEEYRGRGIGTELLLTAERDAVLHGLSYMKLHVEAENAGARRLYQRHGYEETAAGEGADPGDTRLVLRKRLSLRENG